jgi:hypothetical protein
MHEGDQKLIFELVYPSGHRQIWSTIDTESADAMFYSCRTFSPAGDRLELRILSGKQLQRTMKRVQRMGGTVRNITERAQQDPSHEESYTS